MMIALCMNPSFDKTVEVDAVTVGAVNRIRKSRIDLGGKGVNVARVVRRLGQKAGCLVIAGEDHAGRVREALARDEIGCSLLSVPGAVRTNTKIVSLDGQPVTELNEPGPLVDGQALQSFKEMVSAAVKPEDWCVLTGSLPPGCPRGTYRDLMHTMKSARCILDASGEELLLGLEARPWLVKPNRDELRDTLGIPLGCVSDVHQAAKQLLERGARHVIVSMGSEGALLATPEGAWFAPCVDVKVSSTVGAGDAMVGGLLCGMQTHDDIVEAFAWAVAAGTASVMTEGTQLICAEDFYAILPRVRVQRLK